MLRFVHQHEGCVNAPGTAAIGKMLLKKTFRRHFLSREGPGQVRGFKPMLARL